MELPDDPMMLFSMVNMKLRELVVKNLMASGFEFS